MTPKGQHWRPRVVVCGTGFGRVYLAALRRKDMPFQLTGILARGSERSRECARHYGVPLLRSIDELPDGTEVACVVVSAAINGGRGAVLAQQLMARGIHVIQEHPLHQAELAECLRQARRYGTIYHLNSHYVHVAAVDSFIQAARRLLERQRPLFADVITSFQVLYPLADILGRIFGGVRPWSLVASGSAGSQVLRGVAGTICEVPVTLRIQHQIDPENRDNGPHLLHRVTLAVPGGNLLLANTHGPVLWNPRLHMPADYRNAVTVDGSAAGHLDLPSAICLTPPGLPSHRQVVAAEWPAAVARALLGLRAAVLAAEDPMPRGQYCLALCRLVADITGQLGTPEVTPSGDPEIAVATAAARGAADAARSAVTQ